MHESARSNSRTWSIVRGTWLAIFVPVMLLNATSTAAQGSVYAEDVNCDRGPLALQLPATYPAVRALAPIVSEKVLESFDWGSYTTFDREINFDGLKLMVVTYSDKPNDYMVMGASIRGPQWSGISPLHVGKPIRSELLGSTIKQPPRDGVVRLEGDVDGVHISISDGKVTGIVYLCYTG